MQEESKQGSGLFYQEKRLQQSNSRTLVNSINNGNKEKLTGNRTDVVSMDTEKLPSGNLRILINLSYTLGMKFNLCSLSRLMKDYMNRF